MIAVRLVSSTRGELATALQTVPTLNPMGQRCVGTTYVDASGEQITVDVVFDGERLAPDVTPRVALEDADTDQLLAELRSRMEQGWYDYDD